mgnify:CR=1 FL=1
MVNRKKKGKYIGMAGALVVHVAIIALLILVGFTPPEPSEEGGVPVMLGEVPDALRCRPFFSKGGCHAGGNRSSGAGNGGAGHHYAGN